MTELAEQAAGAPVAQPVRIELAHSEPEARAAVKVLSKIWPTPDGHDPVVPELAWVFAHTGNYVAVARAGDAVVGSAIGFRGFDADGTYLHSHIAGVLPEWQGSNIGFGLKQHQRDWALAAGLVRITWTFDPLVARNAYFNVTKLGARLTDYHVNFYGRMTDGINNGDETDRCLATWDIASDRVAAAARGEQPSVDVERLRRDGATVSLRIGERREPVTTGAADGEVRLLQLPSDVVALRSRDRELALAWRQALREVLTTAFAEGYEVTGVSRDGWYVLSRS